MHVNIRYINSTRGTSSKKGCPPVAHIPYISGTLGDTGTHRHKTEPIFIQDQTWSFDLETGSTYKHTNIHICLRVNGDKSETECRLWYEIRTQQGCWHFFIEIWNCRKCEKILPALEKRLLFLLPWGSISGCCGAHLAPLAKTATKE